MSLPVCPLNGVCSAASMMMAMTSTANFPLTSLLRKSRSLAVELGAYRPSSVLDARRRRRRQANRIREREIMHTGELLTPIDRKSLKGMKE
mmetsp:Transcript_1284/g.2815  ORF Transcript_1284/g.2815 Transcript_1284/m.2815 type:complete len:91 (-) Transcript_1284:1916-2188(-)